MTKTDVRRQRMIDEREERKAAARLVVARRAWKVKNLKNAVKTARANLIQCRAALKRAETVLAASVDYRLAIERENESLKRTITALRFPTTA